MLSKARLILDAFLVDAPGATTVLSLTGLSARSGVAKASVHRLCQELVQWGLLERATPGTGYRLGLLLFEMRRRVSRQRVLRDAALRPVEHLLAVRVALRMRATGGVPRFRRCSVGVGPRGIEPRTRGLKDDGAATMGMHRQVRAGAISGPHASCVSERRTFNDRVIDSLSRMGGVDGPSLSSCPRVPRARRDA